MDLVQFSIWKFRHIEGILQGMHSFDVCTTKYVDPVSNEVSWIRYDYAKEIATIEKPEHKHSIFSMKPSTELHTLECKFSELIQTLNDLGMYRELPPGGHHSLAGKQVEH